MRKRDIEEYTIGGPVPEVKRSKVKARPALHRPAPLPPPKDTPKPPKEEPKKYVTPRKEVKTLLSSKEAVASPKKRRGRPRKKQRNDD